MAIAMLQATKGLPFYKSTRTSWSRKIVVFHDDLPMKNYRFRIPF